MANVIEVLKRDHRKVDMLFEQIDDTNDAAKRLRIFNDLAAELDGHANAEETVVYPRAAKKEETRDLANHSYKEHDDIRDGIDKVESMNTVGTDWIDQVKELRKVVRHHVSEEEKNFFPKINIKMHL